MWELIWYSVGLLIFFGYTYYEDKTVDKFDIALGVFIMGWFGPLNIIPVLYHMKKKEEDYEG